MTSIIRPLSLLSVPRQTCCHLRMIPLSLMDFLLLWTFREEPPCPQRSFWGSPWTSGCKHQKEGLDFRPLHAGFGSLFQGDHLGVEFALCSHQSLLEEGGLLDGSHQIKGHHPFPKGPLHSGLVIDDFFVICREPFGTPKAESHAFRSLAEARKI